MYIEYSKLIACYDKITNTLCTDVVSGGTFNSLHLTVVNAAVMRWREKTVLSVLGSVILFGSGTFLL